MEIRIHPDSEQSAHGLCLVGSRRARCALGRRGCTAAKKEGDGKTPYGAFPLRRLWYRPDRVRADWLPRQLPVAEITPQRIWSDDVSDPNYNRPGHAPYRFHHEVLWRADHLYDALVEVGHNDSPPVAAKGSAIFLHVASMDFAPTKGCVAIAWPLMRWLMPQLRRGDRLIIARARQTGPSRF